MNDNYIYGVCPCIDGYLGDNFYVCSDKFLPVLELKIFKDILTELYKGGNKAHPVKMAIRESCKAFNDRFEGYNLKPYEIIITDTIIF